MAPRASLCLLVALFIVATIIGHTIGERTVQPVIRQDVPVSDQAAAERRWGTPSFRKIADISPAALDKPIALHADPDGSLYVLDSTSRSVKVFALDTATLVGTVGGYRQTDGGLVQPQAFAVSQRGIVWVTDPKTTRVVSFSADGAFTNEFKTMHKPLNISAVGESVAVLIVPTQPHLFELYTANGAHKRSFGRLIEQQSTYGIALDGIMCPTDSGFAFAVNRGGLLLGYNRQGFLEYARVTMSRAPLPDVIVSGKCSSLADAPYTATGLQVVGRDVYLSNEDIVDVYEQSDGSYVRSFRAPLKCNKVMIAHGFAITISSPIVSIWKMS